MNLFLSLLSLFTYIGIMSIFLYFYNIILQASSSTIAKALVIIFCTMVIICAQVNRKC